MKCIQLMHLLGLLRLVTINCKKVRVTIFKIFQDTGNNTGQLSIIVNVIDLPDTPPKWTKIFSVEQFDEKTRQVRHINCTINI